MDRFNRPSDGVNFCNYSGARHRVALRRSGVGAAAIGELETPGRRCQRLLHENFMNMEDLSGYELFTATLPASRRLALGCHSETDGVPRESKALGIPPGRPSRRRAAQVRHPGARLPNRRPGSD